MNKFDVSPMLNAYPDSIGDKLSDTVNMLALPEFTGAFGSFYILPSVFNTDLDRGFSVIDYNLNEQLAKKEDIENIKKLGLNLKLDFILNHASVLSPQFQDLLKKGRNSVYADFFIDWNKFWENEGEMTADGYIKPYDEHLKKMFFRKPGLPILKIRMTDGEDVPYWNTFYQQVDYIRPTVQQIMKITGVQYCTAKKLHEIVCTALDEGKKPSEIDFAQLCEQGEKIRDWLESNREYLGQMDLNINSELVWDFYADTLKRLADYGAKTVRLDAFAYAPKAVGEPNFLNEPATWDVLEKVNDIATPLNLNLLPEIHAAYGEKIYLKIAQKGYMTYDFFLPGLLIHAIEKNDATVIAKWAREIVDNNIHTVNMLGCHDGIPLLDLKGLIPDDEIQSLIDTVVSRGGYVKNLDGQKNMYYQVNATYFSALGEDERKMLLARAVQLFMPGKPQIWYLDLFAGKNDYEAVKRAGAGGHKEINRTNLSVQSVEDALKTRIVQKQLEMLKFRKNCPAFSENAKISVESDNQKLTITWDNCGKTATLTADFSTFEYKIETNC